MEISADDDEPGNVVVGPEMKMVRCLERAVDLDDIGTVTRVDASRDLHACVDAPDDAGIESLEGAEFRVPPGIAKGFEGRCVAQVFKSDVGHRDAGHE
ncbi:hypothetical protein D7V80_18760 [Corallococcus sp. CA054B]|uniref:hypothetical protein n=1 Tax=Corallococcus sp. CA054B TaxID=2316734 RepID=UPI000EA153EF|nr:hypothetical protein [Corallococcus sp. CA054B]RKG66704.1 hypothetical protein D7V80_18760 [Corallococcus sp. CA054B]